MVLIWEEMIMKIVLGSDHAGFNLKKEIKNHLEKMSENGLEVIDFGTNSSAISVELLRLQG